MKSIKKTEFILKIEKWIPTCLYIRTLGVQHFESRKSYRYLGKIIYYFYQKNIIQDVPQKCLRSLKYSL